MMLGVMLTCGSQRSNFRVQLIILPPFIIIFSLVSAFSQKNKTYKMGLRVCVCVCMCVCLYSSAHSRNFPSLHLRRSSFSNPSFALPTSQLLLQPFRCFTYVTAHSPTLLSLLLRLWLFTYVTWRAAHGMK